MLIVSGITAFFLFGDETDNGQNNTNQVLCRDVSCGSHLVNDESQKNTIVELKNATHVCCVDKQDENESSDDEDDEEDEEEKSAFGFTISLVLLIAMVALVGFAMRALMKPPRKGEEGGRSGEGGGKPANGGERRLLAATPSASYKTTESGGGARSSAAPQSSTTGASKPEFSAFRPISSALSVLTSAATSLIEKQVDEAKEDAFNFAHMEINHRTEKGMGLLLKISVVIGILIIMSLIGVTVFQGQAFFSS